MEVARATSTRKEIRERILHTVTPGGRRCSGISTAVKVIARRRLRSVVTCVRGAFLHFNVDHKREKEELSPEDFLEDRPVKHLVG